MIDKPECESPAGRTWRGGLPAQPPSARPARPQGSPRTLHQQSGVSCPLKPLCGSCHCSPKPQALAQGGFWRVLLVVGKVAFGGYGGGRYVGSPLSPSPFPGARVQRTLAWYPCPSRGRHSHCWVTSAGTGERLQMHQEGRAPVAAPPSHILSASCPLSSLLV